MITYSSCPCCRSSAIRVLLKVKDYTVSQQFFDIWECSACSFRFTQHVPDIEEIGNYYQSDSYISHTDTRKGLINRLYHLVRKKTLLAKRDLISRHTGLRTGKILDIGAGTGAFLNTMHQAGWEVSGLEPDAGSRSRAEENYGLRLATPEMLFEIGHDGLDVVTMWHVLEHVHDLHGYIDAIKRILKPGGVLVVAVPNYTSYDAFAYSADWAAYDVPRHLSHFSPGAMKKLLLQHGLQLKKIKPMWYDSFYVSMLSEQYKGRQPAALYGFFNGLISNITAIFNREKCSSLIYIVSK